MSGAHINLELEHGVIQCDEAKENFQVKRKKKWRGEANELHQRGQTNQESTISILHARLIVPGLDKAHPWVNVPKYLNFRSQLVSIISCCCYV